MFNSGERTTLPDTWLDQTLTMTVFSSEENVFLLQIFFGMDWLAKHGTCRMLFLPLSCEKSLDNFSTKSLKKYHHENLDWKLQDGDALLSLL